MYNMADGLLRIEEAVSAGIFAMWVLAVLVMTKYLYGIMRRRGLEHNVAVYYNRKVIHILAGGLVAILVPLVFKTPLMPLAMAIAFALLTYLPHRMRRLMYWFQTEDNLYEVHFCLMWGIVITLGWLTSGGKAWLGVVPVLFMSVGDAITGFVRNTLYRRRTKSWWGNVAMAAFSVPLGYMYGIAGMLAGALASFIEHFEFGAIDDNITVPLSSFLVIWLSYTYAPWLVKI